jgi:hypothetical protein
MKVKKLFENYISVKQFETDTGLNFADVKKELIEKQKKLKCINVSVEKNGLEIFYFSQKKKFKVGGYNKGLFDTIEIV